MCGIAGIVALSDSSAVDDALLTSMRDTMMHRGPDGAANWIDHHCRVGLAHRRLAIIDLSDRATQPMANEDGTVWVTYNGEIYNHVLLRQELEKRGHVFRSDHSDTEVLVHGYEQWGIDGLAEQVEGDYGFAIWDTNEEILSLVRDRVGVKPVYFAPTESAFLFGSEIKAVLAHPAAPRDIEPMAMYHYLSFLTTPAPLTMFRGVFKLPAGHYLQLRPGGPMKIRRYWDAVPGRGIPEGELDGLSDRAVEDYYVGGIRQRLEQSIEKRMMSDVPFGVFLSGGVDSSTNVALMSRLMDRPVDSFTVGFKDHTHLNELDHARKVAARFATNHHEILIDEGDMVAYLEQLVHHQDEPIADWVCIPLYYVAKLARDNGSTMIQVGEGADEQFSGYASYMGYLRLYHRYWQPFQRFVPGPLQRGIAGLARTAAGMRPQLEVYADIIDRAARDREHFWSGATVFWDIMKAQLVSNRAFSSVDMETGGLSEEVLPRSYGDPDSFNIINHFLGHFDAKYPGRDALTRMIYNEFRLRLPELLLMRVDKITMSRSLESRVPFLDHSLVEFTMDIPESWKTRNGEAKYLLKRAVEGLIPDEIIYRKKMGFGAPMSKWLEGEFGQRVEREILGSGLMERGYFNRDYIRGLFRQHREKRRDNGFYIWTLFNLTAWYDYWIHTGARPRDVAA